MTTEETGQDAPGKVKKSRSPNFPFISLGKALEKAKLIYRQEKGHPASVAVVSDHVGGKPKSSATIQTIGAMKRFGLLEVMDDGRVKLSKLALDIIRDERDPSPDRDRLVREAALLPDIHKEMWEAFGRELPSPVNVRHHLRIDRGFTDDGADAFVREYEETLDFAGLRGDDNGAKDDQKPSHPGTQQPLMTQTLERDKARVAGSPVQSSSTQPRTAVSEFSIPMFQGKMVVQIRSSGAVTLGEWKRMVAALGALADVFAAPDSEGTTTPED